MSDDDDEADSDTEGETNEIGDDCSEEFDPNESENDGEQEGFNPNDPDGEIEPEQFDPNEVDHEDTDEELESEQFDPNEGEENDGAQEGFNPNDPNGEIEPEQFDPNEVDPEDTDEELESEQFDTNEGEENDFETVTENETETETEIDSDNYDPGDYGSSFGQDQYFGGQSAQIMSTVLINENLIYAYLKAVIEKEIEKENEVEQEDQTEVGASEVPEGEVSELEEFLNQEKERIQLEQEQRQAELDQTIEPEPEPELEPVANEEEVAQEEVKQEQGEEVETQGNISEEKSNNEEKVENLELELDVKQLELIGEKPEEKEHLEELTKEGEQGQFSQEIEEDHEINPESIDHEKEVELIGDEEEEDFEELAKQGELSPLIQELEVDHERNYSETEVLAIDQEEEFEQENKEIQKEKDELIDPQQELEEILEQNRIIEQEALDQAKLDQTKQEEASYKAIEENYEKAKKLYRQETGGKMPIYANKETKGFKLWLEQKKEGKEPITDQKTQEKGEFLENWLKEEYKEEISDDIKEIVENYDELQKLTSKFMELYKKELSQSEKIEFSTIILKLEKIGYNKIVLFSNLRALYRYLNDRKLGNISKKRFVNKTLNQFIPKLTKNYNELKTSAKSITFEEIPSSLFFSLLSSSQIKAREQKYHKLLKKICEKYALKLKDILIEEYGYKIIGLKKPLPLGSHFGFQLTKYTGKVTASYVRRAVSVEILERVKQHIIQKYNTLKNKTTTRETSFKKVITFINEYQDFSEYVSKRFAISRIKYQEGSEKLETKSWLIENLRYLFPKRFDLPITDNLLSWFIFGDVPVYGKSSKLVKHTSTDEVFRQMRLSDLLSINYRVIKLTVEAFSDKGIEITDDDLETLKKNVSYLVYYYVFGGYDYSPQVSATKKRGAQVGKVFFTIEYEVIRAIFYVAAEANKGEPLGIRALSKGMGIPDISVHLRTGMGFGEHLDKMQNYFKELSKQRGPDSNFQIFRDAKEVLEGYYNASKERSKIFQESQEFASIFQGIVHHSMENFFGLKLISEEQVRAIVKVKYITTINSKGVKEKIHVSTSFKFDIYLELNKDLNKYLGLDDKWMGLAIEAMGTYYHSKAFPVQQEADRKKRLICKQKNIILAEIWEDLEPSAWQNEVIKEIKDKTGVSIPPKKLRALGKYLGGKQI